MPRIEITREDYNKVKSGTYKSEKDFVVSLMNMGDIMRGYERERLIEENGKCYACWDSCNYSLD